MLLVDKEIKELINEGILKNANAENIGAISWHKNWILQREKQLFC